MNNGVKSHDGYDQSRGGGTSCKPLLDAATPELFRVNAFRVTGLPVDATTREITKHADRLKMMEELGQGESAHTSAFALKPPPTVDQIREAIQKLKDPERRIVEEFFWFWPERFGESVADSAVCALTAGDGETALKIWTAKETNPADGVVAMHNVAVLWHLTALDQESQLAAHSVKPGGGDEKYWRGAVVENEQLVINELKKCWHNAFKRWEHLADDDLFWGTVSKRVKQLDDARLTTGFVRRMRATLPEALDKVNAELAVRYAESGRIELAQLHVQFMHETNQGLDNVQKTAEMVLTPASTRLKEQIQRAQQRADNNPADAANAARELLEHARHSLALFALFFGKNSDVRNELSDEVAALCNQLPVSFHKVTGDDKTCLDILKAALPFATSIDLRQQIEKNIGTLSGNLAFKELEPVYALLKTIQESKEHPRILLDRFRREAVPALALSSPNTSKAFAEVFNSAAIVLRGISLDAWNQQNDLETALAANNLAAKYATSAELKQTLAADKTTLQRMRPLAGLKPISTTPSLSTVNGIGCTLYGCTDLDPDTGSYLATYYFVILGVPIFPICRYRVTRDGTAYRFFGKAPLRTFDKWHLAISIGLIAWLIIAITTDGNSSSSSKSSYTAPSTFSPSTYTPPVSYDGRDRNTYRVPSSISSELKRERLAIDTAKAQAESLGTQLESMAQEIDRERRYLNSTSQFAVDAFNRKVSRYNSLLEESRAQDRRVNQMVDDYNSKLRRYGR